MQRITPVQRHAPRARPRQFTCWMLGLGVLLAACGGTGADQPADGGERPIGSGASSASPQSDASDLTRVLVDQDGAGDGEAIVVLEDAGAFETWWGTVSLEGSPSRVDFDRELVLAFTATYPSGCEYGFRELRIDSPGRIVEARYFGSEPSDSCGADENPFTVVVAVKKVGLEPGTWTAVLSVSGLSTTFDVP